MDVKKMLAAVLLVSVGIGGAYAASLSEKYTDWGKGPAKQLMTKAEQKQWKSIRSDEDAQKFIDLFWARRDPTPQTPVNEFKNEFDQKVEVANKNFTYGQIPGALTDRGKVYILLGPPTRLRRIGGPTTPNIQEGFTTDAATGALKDSNVPTETWIYESKDTPSWAGVPEMEIAFVDQYGSGEYRLGHSPKTNVNMVLAKAAEHYIVSPDMTKVPTYQAAAPQQPAAPAAPVVVTELKTPELKAAIDQYSAPTPGAYVSADQGITEAGEMFEPVQLYLNGIVALDPTKPATFFGVIQSKEGTPALAFEDQAKVSTAGSDHFVEKSIELQPGEYVGKFGVAQDGKVVALASNEMKVEPLDKGAESVSSLLLSNTIYPLTEAQQPKDPFAYGGIKVVPNGSGVFKPTDEIWYFFEVRNPGLDDAGAPHMQVKLDVEGTTADKKKVKRGAPLMDAPAQPLKGVAAHYGVGSSIPPGTFQPGTYTMNVKLIDSVTKQSYTLSRDFKVVGEK
ncbi:MAG: GWxTD domain-containing protein [Thermoanaerobaculia bacterium]